MKQSIQKVVYNNVFTFLLLVCFLTFVACEKDKLEAPVDYRFFVAGHTYASPEHEHFGLYQPFKDFIKRATTRDYFDFGVLTGDVVFQSSPASWNAINQDLNQLGLKVYITPGNHDYLTKEGPLTGVDYFQNRFGRSYFSYEHKENLYIFLDPNLDHWNISGDQLEFLKKVLNNKATTSRNIFVFFHQVLWWAPDNIYRKVQINSTEGRAEEINFWREIFPLFNTLEKPVYMFAGDVGAHPKGDEYFYHFRENVHFIASGLGSIYRDNFIITELLVDGTVKLRLIGLNCEENEECLGKLEDYQLPN